jgi:uncharacterized membrane protein
MEYLVGARGVVHVPDYGVFAQVWLRVQDVIKPIYFGHSNLLPLSTYHAFFKVCASTL